MLNLRLYAKLRCPKRPRFRPDHGGGGVKAGCPACQDLCTIYELSQQVVQRVKYFEQDYVPAVETAPARVA